MESRTPDQLLGAALRGDPGRPLLTFYDDETGERVELSVATFHNWVAKTANLLQDELAVQPGDRVALLLPAHWQAAVWLMACFSVGAVAAPAGDPASADVVVSGPDTLTEAAACPGERVALALRPLGARFAEPPAGFGDYALLAPAQPDAFAPLAPPSPGDPALVLPDGELTGGDLVTRAGTADRVLSTLPYASATAIVDGLLGPLAGGGSVVLCRHLDRLPEDALRRRLETERVTRRLDHTDHQAG